jgi:uncharacterized protein YneR
MKKLTLLLATFFFVLHSFATDWTGIRSGQPTTGQKVLLSSNTDQSTIRFSLDGYLSSAVMTQRGEAVVIGLDGATAMLIQGAPDLPKMTASVIIPDLANMKVDIMDAHFTDFQNILIAPSKGNLTRDIDPSTIPFEFGPVYQQDAFFPGTLASLRDPYIIRDYRGQTVVVNPFQYNPVTKTLRVYMDITVRISTSTGTPVNPLVRTKPAGNPDLDFSLIYQGQFLNSAGNGSRYEAVPEFGNMLIICYGAFMDAIQPYAEWKKQIGYPVEIIDVGTIGNSNAIKTYIANYYNTKGLTFVLLVGDAAQVPSSSTSAGDSDNNYSYIVGTDHYPDLFIGRFSAENVTQVQTQVQKTLMYEQNPPIASDWFSICTGIGSDQGPGDDGELDYQHIRNIGNNKLLPYTYTYANELFDGTQGGNDEGGNPTPAQVAADINAGTGIINYTGHGSDNSWGTSGFSSSDVNNLTNDNLLPFIWSVACVNGNFVSGTCFAEAWLRATHNGQPSGAVAFLGSTINQSWDPPMVGEDEMDDILVETYPGLINRTFGALSMHGCMQMNDEFGSGGDEMTDTWTCFGDPSLMVRTAMPATLTVIHDPVLFLGATQMTIQCDAEGARTTLSLNGTKLCTGVVQDGSVILTFAALNNIGTATLTITAFNYLPSIEDIDIIPASGPYVVLEGYLLHDDAGNGNGLPDYEEAVDLSINLKNVGIADATNVSVTLSTDDPNITVTDFHEVYPLIPAGGELSVDNGFGITISSDVPDQHSVTFTLDCVSADLAWQSIFIMKINAPILSINTITIDDSQGGNSDGELDPGEQADLTINYSNSGHATAYNVDVYMEGRSGFTEIGNPLQNFASIGSFGVFNKTFTVAVDANAPEGIRIDFANELTMGNLAVERIFPLKVSPLVEDYETGDFTKYSWEFGGNAPWEMTMTYPYEGVYSAKSGTITHNQTSEISVSMNVMTDDSIIFYRKVSSESSDRLKFYINNTMILDWGGSTGGWKRAAFAVTPGLKTFKWVYAKNNIGSGGSDCAWIDYIQFPSPQALTIWAGPDDKVCSGSSYQVYESYGTYYNQIEWTTSGTGTFNDNTNMQPMYTPGASDIESGEVTLSLTLSDNQGNSVSDDMILGFHNAPQAPDVPQGPSYVDLALVQVSDYSTGALEDTYNYNWSLQPAEAGVLIPTGNNATVSWNTDFMGTAYITVAGANECGQGSASQALAIEVDNTLVGIPDYQSNDFDLVVYPNPATSMLNIKVNGISPEGVTFTLVSATGKAVSLSQSIDLEGLGIAPGLYLLIAEKGSQKAVRKILIR